MDLKEKLKKVIIEDLALEDLTPDDIANDAQIFGEEGLGLDSLDAVELVVVIQKHFGVQIKDMTKGREVLESIDTLAKFIEESSE